MYSVVLLMALSGGAETPARCFSSCSSCSSCRGCFSSCHGCFGGCQRRSHGCHGCQSYCSSSSSYCHGCYGGGSSYGCYGGGHGCYTGGGYGCYQGGYGCAYGAPMHHAPMQPGPDKMIKPDIKPKPEGGGAIDKTSAPATIVVNLPADAQLTFDGAITSSTAATRVFVSPALEPGKDYFYTLKAEAIRDGRTVTRTERITVRAGGETRVTLALPTASVAQR